MFIEVFYSQLEANGQVTTELVSGLSENHDGDSKTEEGIEEE